MPGLEKILTSLRWRSAFACYDLIRWVKSRRGVPIEWKAVDPAAPRLVSCVYEADVPLLRHCMATLHLRNEKPPRALLVGDSPEAFAALQKSFSDAGPAVEIRLWQDLKANLTSSAGHFVESWLAGGPFGGYAKKFAVTLAANALEPMVMCDADVLFGGDFYKAMDRMLRQRDRMLAGEDYRASYDRRSAELLGEPQILKGKPLNCGVVYYPSGALNAVMTDELLDGLIPLTQPADNHLEQTLIAFAFWRLKGDFFPTEILETSLDDNLSLKNGLKTEARHYAGGKHLFWRDA